MKENRIWLIVLGVLLTLLEVPLIALNSVHVVVSPNIATLVYYVPNDRIDEFKRLTDEFARDFGFTRTTANNLDLYDPKDTYQWYKTSEGWFHASRLGFHTFFAAGKRNVTWFAESTTPSNMEYVMKYRKQMNRFQE